jgi:hypothetical protein
LAKIPPAKWVNCGARDAAEPIESISRIRARKPFPKPAKGFAD